MELLWGAMVLGWLAWPEHSLLDEYQTLIEQRRLGLLAITVAGRIIHSPVYRAEKGQILVAINHALEWIPLTVLGEHNFYILGAEWSDAPTGQ